MEPERVIEDEPEETWDSSQDAADPWVSRDL